MYIVYLTVMLINMAAAFFTLAWYIWRGMPCENKRGWLPAFTITGFVALITGLHMTFTWPMPSVYNIAFGEPSIMLGVLLLGGAWAIGKCWNLTPLTVYAFLAGIVAIVLGIRFIESSISQEPIPAGLGLIFSGLVGVLSLPALFLCPRSPGLSRAIQLLAILLLVIAGAIWAYSGYVTYWDHMQSFTGWNPNK